MREKLVVSFVDTELGNEMDIEIPLYITADEFIKSLNMALHLNININNVEECFLRTDNPIGLLKGNKLLGDFHLHTGTKIIYDKH